MCTASLARGLEQIEALFPGFQEMLDAGAEVADPGVDLRSILDGRRKPPSMTAMGLLVQGRSSSGTCGGG